MQAQSYPQRRPMATPPDVEPRNVMLEYEQCLQARAEVIREAGAVGLKDGLLAIVMLFGFEPVLQYQALECLYGRTAVENVTATLLQERGGR